MPLWGLRACLTPPRANPKYLAGSPSGRASEDLEYAAELGDFAGIDELSMLNWEVGR